ncbi:MAG: hypothetical protein JF603_02515 [Acidobacteria bacterium]|nr:hypothetical protein [Acidobacteriota bacterium]
MGFGDTKHDEALRDAWYDYCEQLKHAGDELFRDPIKATPAIRAESFRYLTQAISQGFDWHLENQMPLHPFLMRLFGPTRKQAGDKSMSMDYGAYIDGRENYRIFGSRGTVKWITASVLRKAEQPVRPWNEPWALVADTPGMINPDFVIGADGSFELWVGPDRHEGNWLRTTPACNHVRVRQLFDDWEHEDPMTLRIERVGGEPGSTAPPPLLEPDQLIGMLRASAEFAVRSVTAWGPIDTGIPPNTFNVRLRHDPQPGEIDANPGGIMAMCWWELQPDEAMIIRYRPVPDFFWCWELENVWWATPDYRWRLETVTPAMATMEDDGQLLIVVAGSDPGVPNWLDTSGYLEGFLRFRSLLAEDGRGPDIDAKVVKLSGLDAALPPGTKRIDPAGRAEQLRSRAAGVDRRYRI